MYIAIDKAFVLVLAAGVRLIFWRCADPVPIGVTDLKATHFILRQDRQEIIIGMGADADH